MAGGRDDRLPLHHVMLLSAGCAGTAMLAILALAAVMIALVD